MPAAYAFVCVPCALCMTQKSVLVSWGWAEAEAGWLDTLANGAGCDLLGAQKTRGGDFVSLPVPLDGVFVLIVKAVGRWLGCEVPLMPSFPSLSPCVRSADAVTCAAHALHCRGKIDCPSAALSAEIVSLISSASCG